MYEEEKVPKQLKTLYAYLKSGEADEKDTFIQKIHGEVAELNQREELKQVMTLEEEYRMEKQRSLEEGIEIGLQEGRREKEEMQKSIALKLKESGMEIQQIVEMTDLSVEEIEKL
jgi:predicted transposase/invertase (TIGR01784 family)